MANVDDDRNPLAPGQPGPLQPTLRFGARNAEAPPVVPVASQPLPPNLTNGKLPPSAWGQVAAATQPEPAGLTMPGASAAAAPGEVRLDRYRSPMLFAVALTVGMAIWLYAQFDPREWLALVATWTDAILLAIWAMVACRNCRALGAAQLRFTPGIAFLTQILPLANILAGPYTFQELWRRSYGAPIMPSSLTIKLAFRLIICGFLVRILGLMIMINGSRRGGVGAGADLSAIAGLMVIIGLIMRVVLVFQITRRQADAFRRLSVLHGNART